MHHRFPSVGWTEHKPSFHHMRRPLRAEQGALRIRPEAMPKVDLRILEVSWWETRGIPGVLTEPEAAQFDAPKQDEDRMEERRETGNASISVWTLQIWVHRVILAVTKSRPTVQSYIKSNPSPMSPISLTQSSLKKSPNKHFWTPRPIFSSLTLYSSLCSFSAFARNSFAALTAFSLYSTPQASYPNALNSNKSYPLPQPGTNARFLVPSGFSDDPKVAGWSRRVSNSAGLGKPRSQGKKSPAFHRSSQRVGWSSDACPAKKVARRSWFLDAMFKEIGDG